MVAQFVKLLNRKSIETNGPGGMLYISPTILKKIAGTQNQCMVLLVGFW